MTFIYTQSNDAQEILQNLAENKALWAILIFVTFAIILFLIQKIWVARKKRKFVQVEGRIIHVEKMDHGNSDPMQHKGTYKFAVNFKTLEGQEYDLVCNDSSLGFAYAEYADVLNIYYNPINPKDFYAEHKDSRKNKRINVYRTGIFK